MHRLQQTVRHLAVAAPAFRPTAPVAYLTWRSMSSHATASHPAKEEDPVRIVAHSNGCLSMSLQRPKALNSLSLPMVRLLTKGLHQAEHDAKTKCVLVYGDGEKAFCAGGDIRALAFPAQKNDPSQFFREEYVMNYLVSRVRSPYVSIMRGITMGGGVGISVHGQVRVITENTMFAMPETGIGLFPDVGGTYFLPRLPGAIGMFLALTGQSLGASDTMYAGVGTHFIPLADIPKFIHDMERSNESVDALLKKYQSHPPADKPDTKLKSFLPQRRALIDRVFTVDTYAEVGANLQKEFDASQDEDEKKWLHGVQKTLSTKSPTSLLISFECVKLGRQLPSLADCLKYELRVASRISLEGEKGDFAEGVKAVVIDKKHKPQWKPFRTPEQIRQTYFAPLEKELGIPELELPTD